MSDSGEFAPKPVKPTIGFDVIDQIDVRVGTITAVADVPKSRKLVKLTIDFGDHTRSILAGMQGERDDLSVIIGKQALFVVNLAPKEMAGEVSEGMLFDIGYANGITPALAVPEFAVPDGASAG